MHAVRNRIWFIFNLLYFYFLPRVSSRHWYSEIKSLLQDFVLLSPSCIELPLFLSHNENTFTVDLLSLSSHGWSLPFFLFFIDCKHSLVIHSFHKEDFTLFLYYFRFDNSTEIKFTFLLRYA